MHARARPLHRLAALTGLGLVVGLGAWAPCAADVKVEVALTGLDGALTKNILASVELQSASKQGKLPEADAVRLFQRAPQQVAQALERFGYYSAVVHDSLDDRVKPWRAVLKVEPGPPTILDSVEVRIEGPGAAQPAFRKLKDEFSLRPGMRLEHAPYEALKLALQNAAASSGYLDARFTDRRIEVDRALHRGRIHLTYETGPQFFFGEVRMFQDVLDSSIVYSSLPTLPGHPFDADSLVALQNRLTRSPYFSSVEVEPRRDLADSVTRRVPIDVTLEPGKRLGYTLGAGYGTDTGPLAQGSLELRRLNRQGHRAQIEGIVSTYRQGYGGQYAIPRFGGARRVLTFTGSWQNEETDAQTSRGYQVSAALARSRGLWQRSLWLAFQKKTFTVGLDEGEPGLLILGVQVSRIDTDNRIFPHHGRRLFFRISGSDDAIASDATFGQLHGEAKWIRSFGDRVRGILKAEAGHTFTSQFHDLPPGIRYFAGGATDVRAYGYQKLGPSDATGEPTGGSTRTLGTLELEWRFLESWALAGFFDTGGAFLQDHAPVGNGGGAGIRWISPVGMVRLDVAWASPHSGLEANWPQFQFSIGPDF